MKNVFWCRQNVLSFRQLQISEKNLCLIQRFLQFHRLKTNLNTELEICVGPDKVSTEFQPVYSAETTSPKKCSPLPFIGYKSIFNKDATSNYSSSSNTRLIKAVSCTISRDGVYRVWTLYSSSISKHEMHIQFTNYLKTKSPTFQ